MTVQIRSPLDMHLHLREGELLAEVARFSATVFSGAVVMPNLIEPVDCVERVRAYRRAILERVGQVGFEPYLTAFFRRYSREELETLRPEVLAVKLYPAGVTTQSDAGVVDFDAIEPVLADMEDLGMTLLVHGETHGFVMEREREFLAVYDRLVRTFPRLRVVMEHITTADAVEFLDAHEQVVATVTLHHLLLTLDDVVGGLMRPDLFCKPIAKTPRDRDALRQAVFRGHPRVVFGSDSAPHPRHRKECCGCAAGIFSAPVALPLLVELFEDNDCLDQLAGFVSTRAQALYGVRPPDKTVHLERRPWRVPERTGSVTPLWAGQTLRWSVAAVETAEGGSFP